jgi:hypothetical protein
MSIAVLWVVIPNSLAGDHKHFGRTYHLYIEPCFHDFFVRDLAKVYLKVLATQVTVERMFLNMH